MEVLAWIGGFAVLYFLVTFALHMYRMRTDTYYRSKTRKAAAANARQERREALSRSENAAVRDLATKQLDRIEK